MKKIRIGDWVAFVKTNKLVYGEVEKIERLPGEPLGYWLHTTEGITTDSAVVEHRQALS